MGTSIRYRSSASPPLSATVPRLASTDIARLSQRLRLPSFTQGSAAKAPSPRHVAHENYLISVPATNSVSSNTGLGQRVHGGTALGQLECKRSPPDVIDTLPGRIRR